MVVVPAERTLLFSRVKTIIRIMSNITPMMAIMETGASATFLFSGIWSLRTIHKGNTVTVPVSIVVMTCIAKGDLLAKSEATLSAHHILKTLLCVLITVSDKHRAVKFNLKPLSCQVKLTYEAQGSREELHTSERKRQSL